jgi:drug/metabolite transporter (DMT)-like permease
VTATPWLWAVFTVAAAFAQTIRNAMQRELTASLGTVGATQVRFLFGFPFALIFFAVLLMVTGTPVPRPGLNFWPWVAAGAFVQIAATALMLAAMGERSFVVTIAYTKTEPIQVALFGFLGDAVTLSMLAAIVTATLGVIVMSTKPGGMVGGMRPTLLGLASGGALALAVIGFRGAILSLGLADYVMAATFTLVVGLAIQSAALSLYLSLRRPTVMFALLHAWKPSLFAGFMGALASQFWFLAFALATAASVRTLALVEVLFAQLVARYGFGQRTSAREAVGMALVVAGVALLLLAY